MKTLVDEFTAFARFPASKPSPTQINDVLEDALNVFAGRLNGIALQRDFTSDLPVVQADPDQMKRVVVNLIDNAAEALGTVPAQGNLGAQHARPGSRCGGNHH